MLVRNQRVHLGLAPTESSLEVQQSLCSELVSGKVCGVVDSADIPVLHDLAICPACLAEFQAKHRERLLSQYPSPLALHSTFGGGLSRALANQIPLF